AFGHGLSYSTFRYSGLKITPDRVAAAGAATVTVNIENTGTKAGDEVAQLYVHERAGKVKRPAEELRGFQRVPLTPGQRRQVSFTLPSSALAFYDVGSHAFAVNPGI